MQVEQLGVTDIKDIKRLPEIKSYQVFMTVIHKDKYDEEHKETYNELMMLIVTFLKFILTRSKEF